LNEATAIDRSTQRFAFQRCVQSLACSVLRHATHEIPRQIAVLLAAFGAYVRHEALLDQRMSIG
jgi:hypothetical protein